MRRAAILISAILLLCCVANQCQEWWASAPVDGRIVGEVVGITDGDTITVLDQAKAQHKIRLVGIDAPEAGQAFGTRAKQALASLLFQKPVVVEWTERDRFGRIIGDVLVDGRSASLWLVSEGFAWHYTQHSSDMQLAASEAEARILRRGLWSDGHAIPPWEFRRNPEAATAARAARNGTAAGDVTVYVTENGSKYHAAGCRFLGKSGIPTTLENARSRYSACSVCGGGGVK